MDNGNEEESCTEEEGSRQEEVGKGGAKALTETREHSCTLIFSSELCAEWRKG